MRRDAQYERCNWSQSVPLARSSKRSNENGRKRDVNLHRRREDDFLQCGCIVAQSSVGRDE